MEIYRFAYLMTQPARSMNWLTLSNVHLMYRPPRNIPGNDGTR